MKRKSPPAEARNFQPRIALTRHRPRSFCAMPSESEMFVTVPSGAIDIVTVIFLTSACRMPFAPRCARRQQHVVVPLYFAAIASISSALSEFPGGGSRLIGGLTGGRGGVHCRFGGRYGLTGSLGPVIGSPG